ncbi:MAG: ABC transporter permease/substrate-binding protein [Myxococcota bacterium]|nr:ABC transporter permease/substrate-binding protein [Myxococcota bacterium]
MADQLALLPGFLTAHLQLSLAALSLGTLLSVPLGIFVSRRQGLEASVLGVASVIQTIPSLALLAIMVPLLGVTAAFASSALGIELRSIGFLPAWIALTLYSVLPILRNTVTGIAGVDPALVEAARGVGMTPRQQLARVELPLAMPVIVAGLRTATVWVVGTATLSTPVGATSLGNYIFSGLQTRNQAAVLVGCVAAAGLAILLDAIIRGLEVGLRERRRNVLSLSGAVLAALCLYTAGATASGWLAGRGEAPVRIGSKTFSEQYILSELLAGFVEREVGAASEAIQSLGSTVLFDALAQDEIDVYVDYSGTIWATIMKREGLPEDRAEVLRAVRKFLMEEHGIVLAAALGFENTYALAMRGAQADSLGVERLSQLGAVSPGLEIGGDYEFFQRAEWQALESTYRLAFRNERSMDAALMYQAVERGEVDVISAYSTDGRIAALGLSLLVDDRGVIPPYDAIVMVAPRVARERPEIVEALSRLEGRIDASAMQRLNGAVDSGGRSPARVAREFLETLP